MLKTRSWTYTLLSCAVVSLPPLQHTRIGTVLISAAVIDDVIGLVLSSLIPPLAVLQNSSQTTGSIENANIAWTVVRPLLSSLLMATVTPLVARFVLRPLFWWRGIGERWCAPCEPGKPWGFPGSGPLQWFGLYPRSTPGSNWGTEEHADTVKVIISVLFVSAFSSIAYCACSNLVVLSTFHVDEELFAFLQILGVAFCSVHILRGLH